MQRRKLLVGGAALAAAAGVRPACGPGRRRAHHPEAGDHRPRGHALGRAGGGLQGQGRGRIEGAAADQAVPGRGAGRREPDRGRVPPRSHRHVGRHHRGAGHVGARDLGAGAAVPVPARRGRRQGAGRAAARGAAQAAGGPGLRAGALVGERLPLVRDQVGAGQAAQRSQGPQDALAGEPGARRDLPGAGGLAPAHRRHRGAAGAADRAWWTASTTRPSTPSPPPGTWPSSTSPCPSTSTSRARC